MITTQEQGAGEPLLQLKEKLILASHDCKGLQIIKYLCFEIIIRCLMFSKTIFKFHY